MKDYRLDFEGWARDCVRIADKLTGASVPFVLNGAQRRVLSVMERQRAQGRPVRVILLKARQWGGSTLVQVYMAWIQLVLRRDWHSLVCAHVKDASASLRGIYSALLRDYPAALKGGDGKGWSLSPYERSQSVLWIEARGCRISLATAAAPDSLRGSAYMMAHLSEVAFWGDGSKESAERIVRTVCGSVPNVADSVVVMESTANGRDNYFYDEWCRAVGGESDKAAVFVPWHEIEIYREDVGECDRRALLESLDGYERDLLKSGVSLESVAWYHRKRKEYVRHSAMMAEFPSTAEEAFANSAADCPFVDEATLPAIGDVEAVRGLLVAVCGRSGSERAAVLFGIDGNGVVGVSKELDCSGTMPEWAARLSGFARKGGLDVMVADCCGEGSHASWLAGRLVRGGVPVVYDSSERSWHVAWGGAVASLVDWHHELTASGRFRECDEGALELYRDFTMQAPQRGPAVLARLAAASVVGSLAAPVEGL